MFDATHRETRTRILAGHLHFQFFVFGSKIGARAADIDFRVVAHVFFILSHSFKGVIPRKKGDTLCCRQEKDFSQVNFALEFFVMNALRKQEAALFCAQPHLSVSNIGKLVLMLAVAVPFVLFETAAPALCAADVGHKLRVVGTVVRVFFFFSFFRRSQSTLQIARVRTFFSRYHSPETLTLENLKPRHCIPTLHNRVNQTM
jgi:hypothetical protein